MSACAPRRCASFALLCRSPTGRTILLISTGEAAARLVPPPEEYDPALPEVRLGDPIDLADFTEQLEAIGYFSDDRVDEPGELALRGQVIDVFPADSGAPYRLEAQDGKACRDPRL